MNTTRCLSMPPRKYRGRLLHLQHIRKYKSGADNSADGLSRLPLRSQSLDYVPDDTDMLFSIIDSSNINVSDVKIEAQRDGCLSQLYEYCLTLNGWPGEILSEELKPDKNKKLEISLEDGCILWGTRLVIPIKLLMNVPNTLHDNRLGSSKIL